RTSNWGRASHVHPDVSMRIFLRCCILTVLILWLPLASQSQEIGLSHAPSMHRVHPHERHRGFEAFPLLYDQGAWNYGAWNYGAASLPEWPTEPFTPTSSQSIHWGHWENSSAQERAPYPTSQPSAHIIANPFPVDAERDRMWVERCQP